MNRNLSEKRLDFRNNLDKSESMMAFQSKFASDDRAHDLEAGYSNDLTSVMLAEMQA